MLYRERPKDFALRAIKVVSCFIECEGELLFLLRQDSKPQGNTWGVTAGKVNDGERIIDAIIREGHEETGLIFPQRYLKHIATTFVRYPEQDFVYEIFRLRYRTKPTVTIDRASHKDFIWVTPEEALRLPLIPDEDACIRLCYFKKNCV